MSYIGISVRERPPRELGISDEVYADALFGVAAEIGDRLDRCFDGRSWLKQAVSGKYHVRMELYASRSDADLIGEVRVRKSRGFADIVCPVGIPADWLDLGVRERAARLMSTAIQALSAVGSHYKVGLPALRSQKQDSGKPPVVDLLAQNRPSLNHMIAGRELRKEIDRSSTKQMILAAHVTSDRHLSSAQDHVADSLGIVERTRDIELDGERSLRLWLIQRP